MKTLQRNESQLWTHPPLSSPWWKYTSRSSVGCLCVARDHIGVLSGVSRQIPNIVMLVILSSICPSYKAATPPLVIPSSFEQLDHCSNISPILLVSFSIRFSSSLTLTSHLISTFAKHVLPKHLDELLEMFRGTPCRQMSTLYSTSLGPQK